jgi:hypothetical protein
VIDFQAFLYTEEAPVLGVDGEPVDSEQHLLLRLREPGASEIDFYGQRHIELLSWHK